MAKDWWKEGSWNVICDRCGFPYKAEELFEQHDGLMVCKKRGCFELKHPLELVREKASVPEKLPYTRPDIEHPEISVTYDTRVLSCPLNSEYSQADYAAADCTTVEDFTNGGLLSGL